jgi:hypothetical protein
MFMALCDTVQEVLNPNWSPSLIQTKGDMMSQADKFGKLLPLCDGSARYMLGPDVACTILMPIRAPTHCALFAHELINGLSQERPTKTEEGPFRIIASLLHEASPGCPM